MTPTTGPDSLRTRIAEVIVGPGCDCGTCTAIALEKADAVIEALDLREELWHTTDPVQLRRSWGKAPKYRRYVTSWEPSD